MVRQEIDVDGYWKVIVFYDVDFSLLYPVFEELRKIRFPVKDIQEIFRQLGEGQAKAVTCSNEAHHASVVLFGRHEDRDDYLNSLVHEAEHVKQAMLKAYRVKDEGEPPAYTIGYLVSMMYPIFRNITCD